MPVDVVRAHPNVRENAGKAALQRGPIVYCFEEVDNGPNLRDLVLPADADFEVAYDAGLLGGVCTISTTGTRTEAPAGGEASLYTTRRYNRVPASITAMPYYAWSNRTPGEMTVWIRAE